MLINVVSSCTKKKTASLSSKRTRKNNSKRSKQTKLYDPQVVHQLSQDYPDTYWQFHADSIDSDGHLMIGQINSANTLKTLPVNISDQGAIIGMTLSKDGTLLATFSNTGSIKVWDIEDGSFRLLRKIRDTLEKQIDEFFCGQFIGEYIITGGKLKDRHRWSDEDNDNHILACPIKIFNIASTERVARLEGHAEEVLCIKTVSFRGENYLISTSQDGYIKKWHMDNTWT